MLSGHQEKKTKEYVKFLALKVVAIDLNTWEVVAYERVLKQYSTEKQNSCLLSGCLQEVFA